MMFVMAEAMTEIDRLTQTIPNNSKPQGIYRNADTYLAFDMMTEIIM
jgi:hypothetical protein